MASTQPGLFCLVSEKMEAMTQTYHSLLSNEQPDVPCPSGARVAIGAELGIESQAGQGPEVRVVWTADDGR